MTFGTPNINRGRAPSANTTGTPVSVAGLKVEEYGDPDSPLRQTVFTFTAMSMTITDALAYASQQIYDFPDGRINIIDAVSSLAFTTTSTLASTLNASSTCSYGFGTAAASSSTLATTMMNAMPGSGESVKTFTSSATVNVASATVEGFLAAVSAAHLGAILDGTSTARDLFLNVAVPTGTDIDGDATVTVTGVMTLTWMNTGNPP